MNIKLIQAIRETQHAAESCTQELLRVCRRYDLPPEGAEGERRRLCAAVSKIEAEAEEKVGAAIDAKIAELDEAELRATARRAGDVDYLNRLRAKIDMIKTVDIQKVDNATLAAMLAEFKDDSFASEMIRAAIPGGRSLLVEPANGNGKKQEHLREVKKAVMKALGRAGAYISPADMERGSIPFKSEVDALVMYIRAQNEDFSKDDAATWEKLVQNGEVSAVDAWVWQTRFSNSH